MPVLDTGGQQMFLSCSTTDVVAAVVVAVAAVVAWVLPRLFY
jgi:uncharacterized protein (TIGR03382 family)